MASCPSGPRCVAERLSSHPGPRPRCRQNKSRSAMLSSVALAALALASVPTTMAADQCISLKNSTTCPAFSDASVSTSSNLTGTFPFLAFVSDTESFDSGLQQYIATDYARRQYQERIGCSDVNLSNTTDVYARYTRSVLCSSIVQLSISPCSLSGNSTKPLCGTSCGDYALSEQEIVATPDLCLNPGTQATKIIRADYEDCSSPQQALDSKTCIEAVANEPDDCGFQSNLQGLCAFCASSTANATDSCCVNSNVESRCANVHLPTTTSMPPLFTSTAPASSSAAAAGKSGSGLSGGAIAGIVIGSLVGAALILAAVILFCIYARRRRQNHQGSILNTPSPVRQTITAPPMSYTDGASPTILPGARVARMSALEGSSSSDHHSSRAGGVMGAYHGVHDDAYESPDSGRSHLGAALPKRDGSLSSHSALAMTEGHSSPSNPDRSFSSPEGVASGQSEQLQFFKDYYSQDDIHPNDTVATLWAYQPRANDEFELERGDMLKVVGIWDDGWATGVKLTESAEQWESRRAIQRDSGVSHASRQPRSEGESDIKAFPLVCVCLPQHWRKTIEGDSTDTGPGSGGDHLPPSP